MKERRKRNRRRNVLLLALTSVLVLSGLFFLYVASLRIPALEDLSERKLVQSTQIYDRTGEILLYDVSQDVRRVLVSFDSISPYVKAATLAIEDKDFYEHGGIKLSSLMRAVLVNLSTLSFKQGGSTITQQVVKNSILTKDKTPTRKLKEWILAVKLEKILTKDEILNFYLNEIPYGGNVYGIEEAAQSFFGKSAGALTLAESAYLASLPKAPTFYSPYGHNRDRLEERKNLVLQEMFSSGTITEEEYESAKSEEVVFKQRAETGSLKAPHFVFFVIDQLTEKYGEDVVRNGGFKVITTLDYSIQLDAEAIAKKYGAINEKSFQATNNSFVVIDPKTGEILALVGSRDYFDEKIQGNFNVATAHRQPGSTFKPFVYATLFNKGYTANTILFDVPTQFSVACAPDNLTSAGNCYAPGNYDNKYRGPITIRNALAQSVNIPAVAATYLAGIRSSIALAQDMGIESLTEPDRYGLTLVLGGGEVSLLDITAAYSVFANDGMRNPYTPILRVENSEGEIIENHSPLARRVLPEQSSRIISDILSDNAARTPLYGPNSVLYFPERDVAVKTGTSNDYRDAWIIGYTPNVTVGAWAGNNDNSPMDKKVSGLIVAPLWRELMNKILPKLAVESFPKPLPEDESSLKPVLRGEWRGGYASPVYDPFGQKVGEELAGGVHSILHWVDKNNPRGTVPANPASDPQYKSWEFAVGRWALANGYSGSNNFSPAPGYIFPEPQVIPGPQQEPQTISVPIF